MNVWILIGGATAVTAGLAVWRLRQSPARVAGASKNGATEALRAITEWAKWMSGVQTATLAAVAWLLEKSTPDGHPIVPDEPRRTIAILGFVLTGAALFCCAWVLAAVPSMMTRIHSTDPRSHENHYDVQELGIFAARSPRLGNMMALQHVLWGLGLLFFGVLLLWP
jgi:hypothetical protein